MTNLFLVPAADRLARLNFERTVSSTVSPTDLRELSPSLRARARRAPGGVTAWGTKAGRKVTTWEAMEPGDWVLFYFDGRFPAAGRVLQREHSPSAARRLWGADGDGTTWEHMYLMDELRWIEAPRTEVLAALTYKRSFYPRGFTRVDRRISTRYGSVEEMLADLAAVGGALGKALDAIAAGDDAAAAVAIDPLLDRMSGAAFKEAIASRTASAPPRASTALVQRLTRDRKIVADLKGLYEGRCQHCGFTFTQANGKTYSEAAHLRAIANREADLDTKDNLVVLCANHHRMLDYGAIEIEYDAKADELLLRENGKTTKLANKHIGPGRP